MSLMGLEEMERTFPDVGLENYGLAGFGRDPLDWSTNVVAGFGAYVPSRGIIDAPRQLVEVQPDPRTGLARTPMIELALEDYNFVGMNGEPYEGMLGLGDDLSIYQYQKDLDGLGFWGSLWSGIKSIGKKIVGGAKSLISKIPGGKYLVKLHDMITGVAMKLVRPLARFVGKYASKLAPIAALIPGYGPAIAAGLYTAGAIANIMNKLDVKQTAKGKLVFKSGVQAKKFKAALKRAAAVARKKKLHLKALKAAQGKKYLPKGTPEHQAFLAQRGFQPPMMPWGGAFMPWGGMFQRAAMMRRPVRMPSGSLRMY